MELTPRQLSSLSEMGIPVWEFRTTEQDDAVQAPIDAIVTMEPNEQLLKSDWIVLINSQQYGEQERQLLHAMLFSIGVAEDQLTIIDSDHLAMLEKVPSKKNVLLVLGEDMAKSLLDKAHSRGTIHKSFDSQISTVVSFDLTLLLNDSEHKLSAWHDLQLAKQALA